jgi:hypothetical protein
MGSRSRTRSVHYWLTPPELRDRQPDTLGDAAMMRLHIWLRCEPCGHVAVILPEVLAQVVGYDWLLGGQAGLGRRMKCGKCGSKRVRIGAVEPGER